MVKQYPQTVDYDYQTLKINEYRNKVHEHFKPKIKLIKDELDLITSNGFYDKLKLFNAYNYFLEKTKDKKLSVNTIKKHERSAKKLELEANQFAPTKLKYEELNKEYVRLHDELTIYLCDTCYPKELQDLIKENNNKYLLLQQFYFNNYDAKVINNNKHCYQEYNKIITKKDGSDINEEDVILLQNYLGESSGQSSWSRKVNNKEYHWGYVCDSGD